MLIRQLGDEAYAVREEASRKLWQWGSAAEPALIEATGSKDLEVSARARRILRDIRAGIEPGWPKDMIALVRRNEWAPAAQRRAAVDRITERLKGKALPFLLGRLTMGEKSEKAHALGRIAGLANADAKIHRRVIELIPKPANEYQAQALIRARVALGQSTAALALMAKHNVGSGERAKITAKAVTNITALLKRYRFAQAAREAGEFAIALPTDARFLYLQAEGLSAIGKDARAAALRTQALAMHPTSEAPHYTAGELLQHKLGRRVLAEAEWRKILAIGPVNQVYDMNAMLRLHSIYAACGLYSRAAAMLEKATDLVEAARKRSSGVGLVGGNIPSLRKRIVSLRARRVAPNAKVHDSRPDTRIRMNMQVAVKDNKLQQLRAALAKVAATVTVKVQPPGMHLLDKGVLGVRYDAAKRQLGITLNGRPACAPTALDLKGQARQIAIRSEDSYYIFDVPAAGGLAKRVARFEKDYKLFFHPGDKIAACREITITINGKAYQWSDMLAGAAFDCLPGRLCVVVKGKRPTGQPLEIKFNLVPEDPPIPPK